jgi:hypothetical protein
MTKMLAELEAALRDTTMKMLIALEATHCLEMTTATAAVTMDIARAQPMKIVPTPTQAAQVVNHLVHLRAAKTMAAADEVACTTLVTVANPNPITIANQLGLKKLNDNTIAAVSHAPEASKDQTSIAEPNLTQDYESTLSSTS